MLSLCAAMLLQDTNMLEGMGPEIINRFLKSEVVRASKQPTPASLENFEKDRAKRLEELRRSLGLDPAPPKSPLNARVTGTIQRPGYRIEKIVYESRPRFYVTAHLYLPDPLPPGKLPVVVHVNGHWAHKKNEDRIQLRAAFCALRGYAAFAIDSPGHSFEGNALIERRAEGNHNDWFLAMATNTTGFYVWDAIRGLDYLETRPEMDIARVGITGASGGGLATLYTFAADNRYKAAVPVVYMSSQEIAPDNGCLCNHVPGTCQIGDRSDVAAIQAPKPVLIIGAENDPEFPPDAMKLTGTKMSETWALFGKSEDVVTKVFPGPHDYNQAMREAMIGFFNKHLKGQGDGSPVPQPKIEAIDPENRILLAADPPLPNERTMREHTLEYLAYAPREVDAEEAIRLNGGRPSMEPKMGPIAGEPPKFAVTYEPMPGFQTPAIFYLSSPTGPVTIVVDDRGKMAGAGEGNRLCLDIIGTGELSIFEQRYLLYLGRSAAFYGGLQIVAAAKLLRDRGHGSDIRIEAHGPLASQAALWAGLLDRGFSKIIASAALERWEDAFKPGKSHYLVQPRAHLMGSLANLRRQVKNATWSFGP